MSVEILSLLVDAVLVIVFLLGVWGGWRRGFLQATFELVTLLSSVVLAFLFYQPLVKAVEGRWLWLDPWLAPLAFIGLLVLGILVVGGVLHRVTRAAPPPLHRHPVNRVLGLAPGAVNGLLHAVVAAMLVLTLPLFGKVGVAARQAELAPQLAAPVAWVEDRLAPIFEPALRSALKVVTVPPDTKASVPLDFKVAQASPRPELEARMLDMVNGERARQGLQPLKADPELTEVARAHSRDMLARGYFSHGSPEGKDIGDRMAQGKVRWLTAGENLALAQTIQGAHHGLMRSPGHRANILRPQFGRVGIGVLDGGRHGLMVTQNFRN